MKTLYFTAFLLLLSASLWAQSQARLTYRLEGNLNEQNRLAPALTIFDSGRFVLDTMPCTGQVRPVYYFPRNAGLGFNNKQARGWFRQSYTIEMFFKMKELNSWKRVVDFKARQSDNGCYVYNGQLNFYNRATSDTIPFSVNTYAYYVITRDSASKRIKVYSSGRARISFIDDPNDGVLSDSGKLNFFRDDFRVPNEAAAGRVALIRLYQRPLDSLTVQSQFTNLCNILSVNDFKPTQAQLGLQPNPATDAIDLITAPELVGKTYRILAADGKMVSTGLISSPRLRLPLANLKPGVYTLLVENADKLYLRFAKQ